MVYTCVCVCVQALAMLVYYIRSGVGIRVGFVFTSSALVNGFANIDARGLNDPSRAVLNETKLATGEDFAVLIHTALRVHDKCVRMIVCLQLPCVCGCLCVCVCVRGRLSACDVGHPPHFPLPDWCVPTPLSHRDATIALLEAFSHTFQAKIEAGVPEAQAVFTHLDLVESYASGVSAATGAWTETAARTEAIKALVGLIGEGVAGIQATTDYVR